MIPRNLLVGSSVFFYLGIILILLAVVSLPIRIPVQGQPGDVDYFGMGWLFAPIIGVWGLASTVLGLVLSSKPKRQIGSYLSLILALVTVSLAYASYLVIVFGSGIISSVGKGEPFFWVYFSLVLAPSLLIYAYSIKFLRARERLDFLANQKVRIATLAALAAAPLSYTAIFLLLMYLL